MKARSVMLWFACEPLGHSQRLWFSVQGRERRQHRFRGHAIPTAENRALLLVAKRPACPGSGCQRFCRQRAGSKDVVCAPRSMLARPRRLSAVGAKHREKEGMAKGGKITKNGLEELLANPRNKNNRREQWKQKKEKTMIQHTCFNGDGSLNTDDASRFPGKMRLARSTRCVGACGSNCSMDGDDLQCKGKRRRRRRTRL